MTTTITTIATVIRPPTKEHEREREREGGAREGELERGRGTSMGKRRELE